MRARLIVISAPSGCGKTTIAHEILRRHEGISFSVSATTRQQRANEVHGKDYFFLTEEEFKEKIAHDELAEWELIYGNYYGSLKSEIDRALAAGRSILFDIDVKGALALKRKYPDAAVLIFIKPPSGAALFERLRNRQTESEESIRRRIERVPMELAQEPSFDFAVTNDNLARAIDEVDALVRQATADTAAPAGTREQV